MPPQQQPPDYRSIIDTNMRRTALDRMNASQAVWRAQKLEAEQKTSQAVAATQRIPAPSTDASHTDWMSAAGIAPADYGYVDYIVTKESGWQWWATNNEGSGATGLGQALPASKMATFGADYLTNPVTQLRWADSYAVARYGSWAAAYAFWTAHKYW